MDWTNVVVTLIALVASLLGVVLTYFIRKVVQPWLEQHQLTDAADIAVNAAEAIFGRYFGEDKWNYAKAKLDEWGWNVDSDIVIAALKAACKKLDIQQMLSGEKPPQDLIATPEKTA